MQYLLSGNYRPGFWSYLLGMRDKKAIVIALKWLTNQQANRDECKLMQ